MNKNFIKWIQPKKRKNMIDTKLILFEGFSGSGKTTTAKKLAAEIENSGRDCNRFLEWDVPHPIFIGYEKDLVEIVKTSGERQKDTLQKWADFAKEAQEKEAINIIESRFWHTGAMLMYLAGHSEDEVIDYNQKIVTAITELRPVLIYFTSDNLVKALTRTFSVKNEEWAKEGRGEKGWEDYFSKIAFHLERTSTNVQEGREAWFRFFSEWAAIAENLYNGLPFPKTKIQNPFTDWNQSMARIREFLRLA
jgi:thymidylate kinase